MALRIAITGSSGMIGSSVVSRLAKEGHAVTLIIRPRTPLKFNRKVIRWNIEEEQLDGAKLEGFDAVIHLAGANIASQPWTPAYKKIIEESRVKATTLLSETLARLRQPPRILLTASAVGFYGKNTSEEVDEAGPVGHDFLAQVCDRWEKATQPAKVVGIRVVHLRLGMVLSASGGALGKMLPIFKMGLGGKLGSGKQPLSWVALDEVTPAILHIITKTSLFGPVNLVAPQVVTNEEFTKTLGKTLHRPTFLSVPDFMVRLMFGEMAESLLLGGQKAVPRRLQETGYQFIYPDLNQALQSILKKSFPEKLF